MIECIHFFPCLKLCHLRFFWHWEYGPKASGLLESFSELGQCELCGVSRPQFWVKQILWYIMVCLVSCSPKNIVKTISPSGLCLVWNKHYLRHSQGYLTAGMLHAGEGYPCLTIKAWNGRLLVIFLDRCLRAYLQTKRDAGETPCAEVISASVAARAICAWFDAVERAGRYLTQSEASWIYRYGLSFLKSYSRLAIQSALSGTHRWKYIPKLHVFLHINEDMLQSKLNCRHTHCFKDEDHVGLIKRLAVRVHKGPLFEFRILTRWLLRLGSWLP
jgi:hypothetical protein